MNIEQAKAEITQSRTKYQIERFVVGQHHSPEMQYRQLVIEAYGLKQTIKESQLRIEKIKAEAAELRATGKLSDSIEAEILELKLEDMQNHIVGSKRELTFMEELFEQYPKYSLEEIEAAQQDYWETRLTRVAQLQMLSRQGGVDWAQLEAVYQAGIMEQALMQIPTMHHLIDEKKLDPAILAELNGTKEQK